MSKVPGGRRGGGGRRRTRRGARPARGGPRSRRRGGGACRGAAGGGCCAALVSTVRPWARSSVAGVPGASCGRRWRLARPAGGRCPVRGCRTRRTPHGARRSRRGRGVAGDEAAGHKTAGQRLFWLDIPCDTTEGRPGRQYAAAPLSSIPGDLPPLPLPARLGGARSALVWCAVVTPGRLAGARPSSGLAAVRPAPAGDSPARTAARPPRRRRPSRRLGRHRHDDYHPATHPRPARGRSRLTDRAKT